MLPMGSGKSLSLSSTLNLPCVFHFSLSGSLNGLLQCASSSIALFLASFFLSLLPTHPLFGLLAALRLGLSHQAQLEPAQLWASPPPPPLPATPMRDQVV
jgi:hypothetical protein